MAKTHSVENQYSHFCLRSKTVFIMDFIIFENMISGYILPEKNSNFEQIDSWFVKMDEKICIIMDEILIHLSC